MLDRFDRPLFLIGCGTMAGAMLSRWLECGLDPSLVTVLRPSGKAVGEGIAVITSFPDSLPEQALVLLGMKPQQLGSVAPELKTRWREDLTLLSLLAGVSVGRLEEAGVPRSQTIRVMPNTPVALGKGVCALYADSSMSEMRRQLADRLLAPLGLAEWIADEGQYNLVTALTGCGPAFLFRFIDALAQGAAELGLEPAQAQRFAIAMVDGAAALAKNAVDAPGVLAEKVASKGGMTREGLNILDEERRLERLLLDTLRAARDRGVELEKLAS
ncbi:MAG: pyrroline-5-carboxylate reductase [Sphingomonadales bacterium]|nr:MAG: pyrroline-5-carboxylate reductase [Sphingomonadales bacterium]TNF04700.1 MAG: pyrroline-5-carboxylate reductase [Sphingomonadales bacterium]